MLLTNSKGRVVAVTNPENAEQFIVMPGTRLLRIKESLVRKYYLKSLIYTDGAGNRRELMLQNVLSLDKIDQGDFTYQLISNEE